MNNSRLSMLVLLLVVAMGVFEVAHWNGHLDHAYAAGSELPPGLEKGVLFDMFSHVEGATVIDTFQVIEIRGTWVHAKVIRSVIWRAVATFGSTRQR